MIEQKYDFHAMDDQKTVIPCVDPPRAGRVDVHQSNLRVGWRELLGGPLWIHLRCWLHGWLLAFLPCGSRRIFRDFRWLMFIWPWDPLKMWPVRLESHRGPQDVHELTSSLWYCGVHVYLAYVGFGNCLGHVVELLASKLWCQPF